MINFEAELDKLLSLESGKLPQYEFAEFAGLRAERIINEPAAAAPGVS
jgi:hypothetical protein